MTSVVSRDAKRKMPAERHGELLAKAVEISRDEGLSAVTLRKVASALGVTPGLVIHYFSSAEQLIVAAFSAVAEGDLAEARRRVAAVDTATDKVDALMDYVLDDSTVDESANWLDAWSLGRRNPVLAERANALTAEWLAFIGEIVRAGSTAGEFQVADPDVAARRLLTMIDGLGAQKVIGSVSTDEIKHIGRTYAGSELGLTPLP